MEKCESFRVFGEAWKRAPEGRRHGGIESQASCRPQAPFERRPKNGKLLKLLVAGPRKAGYHNELLDLFAVSQAVIAKKFQVSYHPWSRLEDSPQPRLDRPEARAAGAGVQTTTTIEAVAKAGLAADKKGASETLTPPGFRG